jgi:hypothetical protein
MIARRPLVTQWQILARDPEGASAFCTTLFDCPSIPCRALLVSFDRGNQEHRDLDLIHNVRLTILQQLDQLLSQTRLRRR